MAPKKPPISSTQQASSQKELIEQYYYSKHQKLVGTEKKMQYNTKVRALASTKLTEIKLAKPSETVAVEL